MAKGIRRLVVGLAAIGLVIGSMPVSSGQPVDEATPLQESRSLPLPGDLSQPSDDGFLVVGMGDSYGAGEGAPLVNAAISTTKGKNNRDAFIEDLPKRDEVWGGSEDESLRRLCHRSSNAPVELVVRDLRAESYEVDFYNFACSGSSIRHLYDTRYGGQEQLRDVYPFRQYLPGSGLQLPPQILQMRMMMGDESADALKAREDMHAQYIHLPNLPAKRIDVLYLSVGGNDAGFADAVTQCAVYPSTNCALGGPYNVGNFADAPDGASCSSQPMNCPLYLRQDQSRFGGLWGMSSEYNELAARLSSLKVVKDGKTIDVSPRSVIISTYPTPFTSGSQYCAANMSGSDAESREARRTMDEDIVLNSLTVDEAVGLETTLSIPMNNNVRAAALAHGWSIVDMESSYSGNGICAPASRRLVNTGNDAYWNTGPSFYFSAGGLLFTFSSGAVHPNRKGYEVYERALYHPVADSLNRVYLERAKPVVSGSQYSGSRANGANGMVSIYWRNRSPITKGVRYVTRLREVSVGVKRKWVVENRRTMPASQVTLQDELPAGNYSYLFSLCVWDRSKEGYKYYCSSNDKDLAVGDILGVEQPPDFLRSGQPRYYLFGRFKLFATNSWPEPLVVVQNNKGVAHVRWSRTYDVLKFVKVGAPFKNVFGPVGQITVPQGSTITACNFFGCLEPTSLAGIGKVVVYR